MDSAHSLSDNLESKRQGARSRENAKYQELADGLRASIESGALMIGDRLPSYAALRREGYTIQTVEKAQALLESEGLIERRHGSGVFVAPKRSVIRHGLIGFTGLEAENMHEPYWLRLLQGVHDVLDHENTEVVLLKAFTNSGGWDRVDGVLAYGYMRQLRERVPEGVPALTLLTRIPGFGCVSTDDFGGARAATEHLLQLGHRRIAFLVSERANPFSAQRLAGYEAALQSAGLEFEPGFVREMKDCWSSENPSFYRSGRESMELWLRDNWQQLGCTAILTQNDTTARGVIAALEGAGLSVPDDISVVGFDGVEEGQGALRLTTVEVPLRKIGSQAAKWLLRLIEGGSDGGDTEATTLTLPIEFRVGESTAPAKNRSN